MSRGWKSAPRGGKFNVAPKEERTRGGRTFGSKLERQRYDELVGLQATGIVRFFVCQPSFLLTAGGPGVAATTYRADFLVVWYGWPRWGHVRFPHDAVSAMCDSGCSPVGHLVTVEDVKGMRPAAYVRNLRQMAAIHPTVVIAELTRDGVKRATP